MDLLAFLVAFLFAAGFLATVTPLSAAAAPVSWIQILDTPNDPLKWQALLLNHLPFTA